jgi:osmotically-inducible protein OsmY
VARLDRIGPLLVAALGVAAPGLGPFASAQIPVQSRTETSVAEIIVTASRQRDDALTAKVQQVLQDDPYAFTDHITVVTENGVVRLQGFAYEPSDLRRALQLARRAAGRHRVINEIELMPIGTISD